MVNMALTPPVPQLALQKLSTRLISSLGNVISGCVSLHNPLATCLAHFWGRQVSSTFQRVPPHTSHLPHGSHQCRSFPWAATSRLPLAMSVLPSGLARSVIPEFCPLSGGQPASLVMRSISLTASSSLNTFNSAPLLRASSMPL